MCITRPVEVLAVQGTAAQVRWQGQPVAVNVSLIDAVAPGDWLLVHAGVALEKLDPAEALEVERLLAELEMAAADLAAVGGDPVAAQRQSGDDAVVTEE